MLNEHRLFSFSNSQYCGVLVTENVMKKIAKLEAKYLNDIRLLLSDEHDRGNVISSDWGIVYPEGKTTYFYYSDKSSDVKQRIKVSCLSSKIEHRPVVFIADNYEDAQKQANEYFGCNNKESLAIDK